jgi:hypothetical protein
MPAASIRNVQPACGEPRTARRAALFGWFRRSPQRTASADLSGLSEAMQYDLGLRDARPGRRRAG